MVSAFLRSFNEAYDTGNRVSKDIALARTANAQEEEVNIPDLSGNGQTGSLDEQDTPMKKGIKFLGQTYDANEKDKISEARQQALAGIHERYGDSETANRIRSGITQNKLAVSQIKQAEAQDRQTKRAEELQAKSDLVNQDVANYTKQYATNPDGTERALNYDDQLHLGQYQASKLVSAGLLDDANKLAAQNMQFAANKIQIETVERKKALGAATAAAAAGDLSGIKNFYNKFIPDGAQVTNITTGKDGKIYADRVHVDGTKLPTKEFKNVHELVAAAQSLDNPEAALNFANNALHQDLQNKQLELSRAGLGLQSRQVALAEQQRAREIKREDDTRLAGVNLFQERNPNATRPQLEAVKAGILPAIAGKGQAKVDANEVSNALSSGAFNKLTGEPIVDPLTGKQQLNRNKELEDKFYRFIKKNNITDTDEGLLLFLGQEKQLSKPANADAAKAEALDAISRGVPKDAVNQRLKELGFGDVDNISNPKTASVANPAKGTSIHGSPISAMFQGQPAQSTPSTQQDLNKKPRVPLESLGYPSP